MVEDCVSFLKVIEDLKPYIVEFKLDKTMNSKIYPNNYIVESSNQQLVIIIIDNKYTFFANNDIRLA